MPDILPTAQFPTSVWNGRTPSRRSPGMYKSPDHDDYEQIVSEMTAVQQYIKDNETAWAGGGGGGGGFTSPATNSLLAGTSSFLKANSHGSVNIGALNNQTGGTINTSTGVISGTPVVAANIGKFSVAVGSKLTTSGDYGTAIGYLCNAGANGIAIGRGSTASGYTGFAMGMYSTANGSSVAIGSSCVSANGSVVVGINSTSSTFFNSVIFGNGCSSLGIYGFAAGNNCKANNAGVALGKNSEGNGVNGIAIGDHCFANADHSIALGNYSIADKQYQLAFAGQQFAARSDSLTSVYVMINTTNNNTPLEIYLNGSSARLTLADNSLWAFEAIVIARNMNSDENGSFRLIGCIQRRSGTTSLVGTVAKTTIGMTAAVTYDVAATADNANSSLKIAVTGHASDPVRWVAFIRTVEVHLT